jgi:hypothetical protein
MLNWPLMVQMIGLKFTTLLLKEAVWTLLLMPLKLSAVKLKLLHEQQVFGLW